MISYKIVEVDIEDENTSRKVNNLLGEVFGGNPNSMPKDKLKLNTFNYGENKSLYLAAIEENEIIGFNAFISHTFSLNNESISGYQSCWTATSNKHRGKGIFQNIMEEAKKILLSRNAGFIFGFPNANSHPIFINKLNFKEYPSLKLNIPNLAFFQNSFFSKELIHLSDLHKNSIIQDNGELFNIKKREYGKNLIRAEEDNSFIWGVIRTRVIKGIKLSFFEVGGIEIEDTKDVPLLIKKISKNHKFSYVQLVMVKNNSYNTLFKRLSPASTNDLIVFDLKLDTSLCNFNFFGGVKDVY